MSEETITSEVEAVESTEAVEETVEEVAEKSWRDELPDDLQGVKTLEKFKDVSGLAKSYVETERYFEEQYASQRKTHPPKSGSGITQSWVAQSRQMVTSLIRLNCQRA